MSAERTAVCVFAKPPHPGRAKARLAAVLGDETAAELARAFVVDTWSMVRSLRWADPILATTDDTDPFWAELPGAEVWPQGDGDLGDRMERVFQRALRTHQAAIIMGSDVPGLPRAALDQARAALRGSDVVIGPSEDGGFYLIGFRHACPPGAFAGIEWSTRRTRAEVESRLRTSKGAIREVAGWFDIDSVDDLHRLRQMGPRWRLAAPETARVLNGLTLPAPARA